MVKPSEKIAVVLALALLSWGGVVALGAVFAAPSCAYGQTLEALPQLDAGPVDAGGPMVAIAPAMDPPVVAAASGDPTVEQFADKAFDAIALGDWWALAAVAVLALTAAIRSGAASAWASSRAPSVAKFIADPVVSFCLPLILSAVPGVLVAVKSGKPFTASLLIGAIVKVAGGSKIMFLGWKNIAERRDLIAASKPPPPAPTAPGGT